MLDSNTTLRNRIIKMMEEEEFKDNANILRQGAIDDFANSIVKNLMVKKISNEDLRNEIRNAFKKYFEADIEVDFVGSDASKDNNDGFKEYNEYLDRFKVLFTQMDITSEQKSELFNIVASINNFGMYYVMLFRSLSNAIYDTVDPATANIIISRAAKQIGTQTEEMFRTAEDMSTVEQEQTKKQYPSDSKGQVIDFKTKCGN